MEIRKNRQRRLRLLLFSLVVFTVLSCVFYSFLQNNETILLDVSVSLVIPATHADFKCFVKHFAESLQQNTGSLPDEVIFIVSSWSGPTEPLPSCVLSLMSSLQTYVVPFTRSQNQARNRNVGATLATGDYVFFFDIDDVIHPAAFDLVRQAITRFEKPDTIMFSHGPYESLSLLQIIPRIPFCINSRKGCALQNVYVSEQLFHDLFQHWFDDEHLLYTHFCCLQNVHSSPAPGWLLARRSIFLSHGVYDDRFATGEDGNQIARMLSNNLEVLYLDLQIGYYNRRHDRPSCGQSFGTSNIALGIDELGSYYN